MTEILEDLGVTYVLGGSVASTLHGEPRATLDVDIAAALREEHIDALLERVEEDFYAERASMLEAVRERTSFNLIHLPSSMKVDIFVPPSRGIHEQKWRRRQRVAFQKEPERSAWVTDPEDIVLQKVDWYRDGGGVSDSQWRDVLGVLKVQGERLDLAYLRHWAAEMKLVDLLDGAFREAGLEGFQQRP